MRKNSYHQYLFKRLFFMRINLWNNSNHYCAMEQSALVSKNKNNSYELRVSYDSLEVSNNCWVKSGGPVSRRERCELNTRETCRDSSEQSPPHRSSLLSARQSLCSTE